MEPEELDGLLRESAYFRGTLVNLLQSTEQTLAVVVAAAARQIDPARLLADIQAMQRELAVDDPNPTRDHFLNAIHHRLQMPRTD